MPKPAERWIVLAIGLVLIGLALYGFLRLSAALIDRAVDQLPANPPEGKHIPCDANDHGRIRRGVPD